MHKRPLDNMLSPQVNASKLLKKDENSEEYRV